VMVLGDVLLVFVFVLVLEVLKRWGNSALLDIDLLRRNLWDQQAMCLHKLVFLALGVLLLVLVLALMGVVVWLLLLLMSIAEPFVALLEVSCASAFPSILVLLLLLGEMSGTISICCSSMISSKLAELLTVNDTCSTS